MTDIGPEEPKLYLADLFSRAVRRVLPERLRATLVTLLLGVTPSVPVTLRDLPSSASARRAFTAGSLVAFVFCFIGTLSLTFLSGTHFGSDPTRVYFLKDLPNLINYIVICPLYCGLATAFIVLVLQTWHRLYVSSPTWSTVLSGRRSVRLGAVVFIVLAASAVLTVRYMTECLDPAIYPAAAWYIQLTGADHSRSLGSVGVYYALLNFCLLTTCLAALAFVGPYLAIGADLSRALRSTKLGSSITFAEFRAGLTEFTHSYIAAKLLAAVLMANAYTWKWERPIGSLNFFLLAAVLSSIGVFVVSFPRYYVELEWYYFEVRRSSEAGLPLPTHCDDLRSRSIRLLAHALDVVFGVSFVWSIWP